MDAALLTTLASPRRREILRMVWTTERSAGQIHAAMPDAVSFGAVSLQLRVLANAGLVQARVEGRHRYYRARKDALGPMAGVLTRMWDDALWRLKLHAELEHTRRGPAPRRAATKSRRGTRP
jgi:DNA-binding transcriptional ArsR family regulator